MMMKIKSVMKSAKRAGSFLFIIVFYFFGLLVLVFSWKYCVLQLKYSYFCFFLLLLFLLYLKSVLLLWFRAKFKHNAHYENECLWMSKCFKIFVWTLIAIYYYYYYTGYYKSFNQTTSSVLWDYLRVSDMCAFLFVLFIANLFYANILSTTPDSHFCKCTQKHTRAKRKYQFFLLPQIINMSLNYL